LQLTQTQFVEGATHESIQAERVCATG